MIRRARTCSRGSVLAALVVVIAISAILMTAAATKWEFIVRREKEKELIFRGTAIARAIQEYQGKGRLPTTFEEMMKVRPPLLRQEYVDPMTARYERDGKLAEGTGQWARIPFGQQPSVTGAVQPPFDGSNATGATGPDADENGEGAEGGRDGRRRLQDRNKPQTVQFAGVRSRSEEKSIGMYGDIAAEKPYSEWRFQAVVPGMNQVVTGGVPEPHPPGFGGYRPPGGPPYIGGAPMAPRPPQGQVPGQLPGRAPGGGVRPPPPRTR